MRALDRPPAEHPLGIPQKLEPSIKLRVSLVPDIVTGNRSDLLTSTGPSSATGRQCHYTDTLGPAKVPAKTMLALMHLGKPQGEVTVAIAHLK